MVRLADAVQVRKETWGLLFYSQSRHKLCFVRSGNWLEPEHFNSDWSLDKLTTDITERTGKPIETVKNSLRRLAANLIKNGMVVDELC